MRGVGANIIYCEEAAYMDLNVWYQVIIPCLEVGKTAVIMISTPQGRWNFYSELTSAVDDRGMSIFNVVRCFAACTKCVEEGKETDCTHVCENRPHWKPEASQRKMVGLYGNQQTMYQREILGKVMDDQSSVFAQDKLDALFNGVPQLASTLGHVATIYVAVDPNGGGASESAGRSQTAIVSVLFHGANVIVSVLDNTNSFSQSRHDLGHGRRQRRRAEIFHQRQHQLLEAQRLGGHVACRPW